MLVLTRKTNETVVIGENIRVTIKTIHGPKVRLGIEAPQEVTIVREELNRRPGHAPRTSSGARSGHAAPSGGRCPR